MLALLGLVTAALFTGASLYVSWAENPARIAAGGAAGLAQWRHSYPRAALMQAGLAIVSGLAGIAAWYRWRSVWPWLIGGLLMLANIAWTLLVVWKTNARLKALRDDDPEAAALLAQWGRLHLGRTLLGAAGTALFVYGMT